MNYTALTIGPIYKTLHSVKSTKAIWAASYLFSYLMKEIIKEIKLNPNVKIILPYSDVINGKKPLEGKFQTGLFPDRIIVEGEIKLQEIIDRALQNFSTKSGISQQYLENYLNFYHLNVELDENKLVEQDSNVIIKINELLDSLELRQRVLENANDNSLVDFFERKYPYNFLIRNEFNARPFPSTIEISTAEYEDKYGSDDRYKNAVKKLKDGDDENQIEFIRDIKAIVGESFRNYQKYIAVVQADGDNIGSFIKQLYMQSNKHELIERFSKNLLSFAIDAVKLIQEEYKGTPIYAGGDDLLFFAPVAHISAEGNIVKAEKTIFTLISQIDDLFKNYFTDCTEFKPIIANVEKKPSMSYGVSISYYKFPLNEALEEGVNQLFYTAKITEKKNAVSYSILKHSGQSFGTTFHKDENSYQTFTSLLVETVNRSQFITSISYKLDLQKAIIQAIGEKDNPNRDEMFNNFFYNNFNESIHRDKYDKEKLIGFLEMTKQLFKDVYTESELSKSSMGVKNQNEINIQKIYSALRFIEFIHNKEERDE